MEITELVGVAGSIGTLVFLITVMFGNYRRGDSQAAKEALDIREKQIQALRDEVIEIRRDSKEREDKMNAQITDLTGKVGQLTGLLESRDKEVESLKNILANRDPEMTKFFNQATSWIQMSDQYFKTTSPMIDQTSKMISETVPKLIEVMNRIDTHIKNHK